MTREEQIRIAIDEIFPCGNNGRTYEQAIAASGFEAGVRWADRHIDTSVLWHDASDIPNNDSLIIYESVYGDILLKRFTNRASAMANVLRWAYVNDLLPKGGE